MIDPYSTVDGDGDEDDAPQTTDRLLTKTYPIDELFDRFVDDEFAPTRGNEFLRLSRTFEARAANAGGAR